MLLFSLLWLLVVYCPIAHWVWGDGWLQKTRPDGFRRRHGGAPERRRGGAGLRAGARPAPRLPRDRDAAAQHDDDGDRRGMLWVGWFGFNAGSALAADGAAGMAMLVTHIGAATGAFAWMLCEWLRYGKPSVLGIVTGMVAGLGTITPASGFVGPIGALVIGGAAGVACFFATNYMKRALNDRRLARRVPGARRRRPARHAAHRHLRLGALRRHRLSRQGHHGRPGHDPAHRRRRDRRSGPACSPGSCSSWSTRWPACALLATRKPRDSTPCCTTRRATTSKGMERRDFIKFCAASAAALGAPERGGRCARRSSTRRARLVDEKGAPLRASAIPVNRNLIFHYPFAATPCFLLNLGKPVKPAQLKTGRRRALRVERRRRRGALGGRLLGDLRAPARPTRPRTSASSASAPRRARATASPT